MTSADNAAAETEAEPGAKAAHKRYECLVTVRNKAINGKGAWYWAHLEPILVHNSDTGLPKSVKLRCSLCDTVFSASNPSRTASEHLKRRTCPDFAASCTSLPPPFVAGMKRPALSAFAHHQSYEISTAVSVSSPSAAASFQHSPTPITIVEPPRLRQALSGGKEDLARLAMLEDSVKRLKSPRLCSPPRPSLSREQIDAAIDYLYDWVHESCGDVSLSSLDHPKFRGFLNQVGLPPISTRSLAGGRLDAKFEEAKAESEARIGEAMFFQIASDGWKSNHPICCSGGEEPNLVNLTVNLPNGTSLYRRAVFVTGSEKTASFYAEDVLLETAKGICGEEENIRKCVGIVSDRFKSKALRNLEDRYPWMVNLCCQIQGFRSLAKDLAREIPLFQSVAENCLKLGAFVNSSAQIREKLYRYQFQEYGCSNPLRVLKFLEWNSESAFSMIDDVLSSAKALQMVLTDESCNLRVAFWSELEAVHSLAKLVKEIGQEIEAERPLIGRCLPIWEELGAKVREWSGKYYNIDGFESVLKVIERRFEKTYHPAMAAAYVLDPLYLVKDASGKYIPPFKHLTPEQEKDVGRLLTRLVSREEAHIALMELMKWRTEGLDPAYARAVQMKERDPVSGKMRLSNPQSSRLVWETCLSEFRTLGKVAVRVIFLHATSSFGFKSNSFRPLLRWVGDGGGLGRWDSVATEKAQKMIFVAAHSKLERRGSFSSDGDADEANGDDDGGGDDTTSSI